MVLGIMYTVNNYRTRERNKMSFMEAFNLTEMPIVTLFNDKVKLNFLLDTGSNHAFLSRQASGIKGLSYTEIPIDDFNILGCSGSTNCNKIARMPLSYKDNTYVVDLHVLDSLDDSFKSLKESEGVQLHGIIGTRFLQEHNFVLDFDELVAYKKK